MGLGPGNRRIVERGCSEPGIRAPVLTLDFRLGGISQRCATIPAEAPGNSRRLLELPYLAFGHCEIFCRNFGPGDKGSAKGQLARAAVAMTGPRRRASDLIADRAAITPTIKIFHRFTHPHIDA